MARVPPRRSSSLTRERLSAEERRSLTSSGFRMRPRERLVYTRALEALTREGPPFVVSGLFALHQHTGIYRETKDLDVMLQPSHVVDAARVLKAAGFRVVLSATHWLAKARDGELFVDLVYGMANGLHLIDESWIRQATPGEIAGIPILATAPEDLIFHRLFIWERHRSDMSDVAHLILTHGDRMDWDRLVWRAGDHWRLLLAQIHFFDFVYPGRRESIPEEIRRRLLDRASHGTDDRPTDPDVCQGTLISRFSFSIDVHEWGFHDLRTDSVNAARSLPIIREIERSDVWDAVEDRYVDEEPPPAPWGMPGEMLGDEPEDEAPATVDDARGQG
jgi:hypothetical protein